MAITKFLFHIWNVFCKSVFSCKLSWVPEMINFLPILHLFINLWFLLERNTCPEKIPFILVCLHYVLRLKNLLQNFGLSIYKFEIGWFVFSLPRHFKLQNINTASDNMQQSLSFLCDFWGCFLVMFNKLDLLLVKFISFF